MDSLIQLIDAPEYNKDDGMINGLPVEDLIKAIRNIGSTKREKKGNAKGKRKRGGGGPKRVSCSFMKWRKDNYENIKKTYFNDYESNVTNGDEDSIREYYKEKDLGDPKENNDGTIKKPKLVALISIKAGQLWKEVDTETKKKYDEEFRIEKEKYDRELEEYKDSHAFRDRNVLDEEEDSSNIDLPEGWSQPITHKSISKTIKGEDGKTIKIFKSIEDAIQMAQELGCSCYGITQTKRGFSVRTGELIDNEKAICSWVKLDFEPPIKAKRGRPSTKPTMLEDSDDEVEDEDEDEEDNTIEVEEICINGKDYYIDRKSKKLYDIETNEVVGLYEEED